MIEKFLKENSINYKKNYNFGKNESGFKVDGFVKYYLEISNSGTLFSFLKEAKKFNIKVVPCGCGSNILIKDNFDGVFLRYLDTSISIEGSSVVCGSGIKKEDFLEFCTKNSLSGAEFLAGIPGRIGGSIFMNSGAYNSETKDIVKSIYITNHKVKDLKIDDLKWAYRKVFISEGSFVTKALFSLKKGNKNEIKANIDKYIKDREDKHPLEYPSCGSTFKNLKEKGAWEIIKDLGLSGFSIGGASVSKKHTNFIINKENAKAKDILKLISYIKNKAKENGVSLQEEVKII
jgi:UDP-N-acetylmuramate dehydrogenase